MLLIIWFVIMFLAMLLFFMLLNFTPDIIETIQKKKREKKKQAEREAQDEERRRRKKETSKLKSELKPKYQGNPNLNKMFDDCVNYIISSCKKALYRSRERRDSEAFIYFVIDVDKFCITIRPNEEWYYYFTNFALAFEEYGIIPLEGDNVEAKVLAIKELLAERLCSEINKIDSNIKAKFSGSSTINVTITNEYKYEGVRL